MLAILCCILMMGPVLADMVIKAMSGQWLPSLILIGYIAIGALIYWRYGYHIRTRVP